MRSVQDGLRTDFSIRLAGKTNHLVAGIGFHRENVATYGIHIKAIVELKSGLITLDDSLWLCNFVVLRSFGQSIENPVRPQVVVLKNDFIGVDVDGNRTVRGGRIADCSQRRPSSFGSSLPRLPFLLFRDWKL